MSIRNLFLIPLLVSLIGLSASAQSKSAKGTKSLSTTSAAHASKKKASAAKGKTTAKSAAVRKKERVAAQRQLKRMNKAFVASSSLKPMARQLLQSRTKPAYAGVEAFAQKHAGTDAGAMAQLVIGYAHILDREYAAAAVPLKKASLHGGDLGDYYDYFLATAYNGMAQQNLVASTLRDFDTKHPGSIFVRDAAVMYAEALVNAGKAQEALTLLSKHRQPQRADIELNIGRAYLKLGQSQKAAETFSHVYYTIPLAGEASEARAGLDSLSSAGISAAASFSDRKQRADLLANARRFSDAVREYKELLNDASPEQRNDILAALGVALHRSGNDRDAHSFLDSLPDSPQDYNAKRLLALAEMARSANDEARFTDIIARLRQNNTSSPYFAEALLLGGNMYLLKRDYDHAIDYFRELQQRFPDNKRGSYAHWKAAWLSLRQGRTPEAKKLFEEQIQWYPTSAEVPNALYWRGRLAEEDRDPGAARQYYEKLATNFRQYYYADLARTRLKQMGTAAGDPPANPFLEKVPPPTVPAWVVVDTPAEDVRLEKSKLLDNGGLLDFAVRELRVAATDGDSGWANREIARTFKENDRYDRALQTLKRAIPSYYALETEKLPRDCWEMLFPRPYWNDLSRYAKENGLDPFLVAALIRQESEFNPGAMSSANAYGLMQLLPGTGKTVARSLKVKRFSTPQLLTPSTNLQLGTRYFRDMVDRYNGQYEYALAAYNAGAERVDTWLANGPYRDPQEFVESIPFTETREYVQAIVRNASIYRKLYATP